MEARTKWGNVIWAAVFAVAVIATAGATYFFENNGSLPFLSIGAAANPNDRDKDGLSIWEEKVWGTDPEKFDTDGDGASDGAEVAAGSSPTTAGHASNAYEGGSGVAPTIALIDSILAVSPDTLTDAERQEAVSQIARTVALPDLAEKITLADLNISAEITVELYGKIVYEILRESVTLEEYELAAFRRAVADKNYYGMPQLTEAAKTYREIEAALVAMRVPPQMAAKHLALVNDIGTLANAVAAMAAWGGDPLAGMAYAGTFLEAEARVEESMIALFNDIAANLKKSS